MTAFVDDVKRVVEGIWSEATHPDTDMTPALVVERSDGTVAVLPSQEFPADEDQKSMLQLGVWPSFVVMQQARRAAVAASAWMGDVDDTGELLPARVEVVVLNEITATSVTTWVAPILRSEGEPPVLGEWEELDESRGGYIAAIQAALGNSLVPLHI